MRCRITHEMPNAYCASLLATFFDTGRCLTGTIFMLDGEQLQKKQR